ncbi:hypothetical protein [Streptomyces sp. TR06-5]|uniref:hypothetical protein n=1 Tax=unclassified Streptomyces TaxID=2593676 RepID=UPI0039A02EAC
MFWEACGSVLVGLALAWSAAFRLPSRLPRRGLVLPTGAGGGLLGGMVAYAVMGPGNLPSALLVAAGVAAAMLSLLHVRPPRGASRPHTAAPRTAAPRTAASRSH